MGDYKDLNDYEIIYMVKENDDDAIEILFRKYRPVIVKIASNYLKIAKSYGLELEDLIQEGYIALYSAYRNYSDIRDAMFYTFVNISVHSKMLNCLRLANTKKNKTLNNSISLFNKLSYVDEQELIDVVEDNLSLLPENELDLKELESIVRNFILELNYPQSCVFELNMNGFSNLDIAYLLDLNKKQVTNHLFSARKKFQSYLMHH